MKKPDTIIPVSAIKEELKKIGIEPTLPKPTRQRRLPTASNNKGKPQRQEKNITLR